MSILKAYETGDRKEDKGHFRNLVLIARADGELSAPEREMLDKIARKIGLSDSEKKDIILHPMKYPINPPADRTERFEQIVNMVQMAQADGHVDDSEMEVIEKIAVGIGYDSIDDVDVESILALIIRGEDTDVIIDELL